MRLPHVFSLAAVGFITAMAGTLPQGDAVLGGPLVALKHPALGSASIANPPAQQIMASAGPTDFFQVAQPVIAPEGPGTCTIVLMDHAFANSYGAPFVADYVPPTCDFNHVVIRFTSTIAGRQFDRTGVMYLTDTEVWRLTTPEPTAAGIIWSWDKDMTHFLSLWKQPQKLIFDLENIVDDTYTGIFNTTLTATFYQNDVLVGGQPPADLIIPISERLGAAGQPSQFTYPEQNATNTVAFPQNANRAVFSIASKGQGNDEFWWSNVPESAVNAFGPQYGVYPGYSAWREIQVLIDGQLAGVSWPYPTIFTGGVVPQLHRPIVGIDAYDMREHEIDITPWLPLLCDGNEHTFTIKVVGLVDNGSSSAWLSNTTESSWYLTGKVFVWLDSASSITTGTAPVVSQPSPSIDFSMKITQNATGANETLQYNIDVSRKFSVSAKVKTEKSNGQAIWLQTLSYSNPGVVSAYGYNNLNTLNTIGSDSSTGSVAGLYAAKYHYPLFCNSTSAVAPAGNLTLWAKLDQGLQLDVVGSAVIPTGMEGYETTNKQYDGSSLSTNRVSTANFFRAGDNSFSGGGGSQEQTFDFWGVHGAGYTAKQLLYHRAVTAANTTVLSNEESGL